MGGKISFFLITFCVFLSGELFAQTEAIRKIETLMLKDQYSEAARECKKILLHHQQPTIQARTYYLLGLCQLKEAEYEQARKTFRTVLGKFRQGNFSDDASLGIADSYLLAGDFKQARKGYEEFLSDYPRSNLADIARKHLEQSKQGNSFDNSYFSVQVGVFSQKDNATTLRDQLIDRGFQAFVLELPSENLYRVRVGKFNNRMDAEFLEQRLKSAGYPTKICP